MHVPGSDATFTIQKTTKMASETQLNQGDKVKTVYGKIETVCDQIGNQVFTYESISKGNQWWHPTKVHKI